MPFTLLQFAVTALILDSSGSRRRTIIPGIHLQREMGKLCNPFRNGLERGMMAITLPTDMLTLPTSLRLGKVDGNPIRILAAVLPIHPTGMCMGIEA
jgi:hypothetical protein